MILSEQTFIELAGKQEVLDAKIKAANGVEELPLRRIGLYYRIELAECLNELKGDFKHWSNKPMNREAFIEEMVDTLHFFLSLTNHLIDKDTFFGTSIESAYAEIVEDYDKYQGFISGAGDVPLWDIAVDSIAEEDIAQSFSILLYLAERYGFTEQDIIDTYNKKNAVNHDRSDSGVY